MALRFGFSLKILIEKKRSSSRAKVLKDLQREAEDEMQDA